MLRDVLSLVMWPFSACDRFQLGNALQRFLDVINRTYSTLILKMTNLINCTDNYVTCTKIFKIQKQLLKVFLKISQNSQESTYARASFLIKLLVCNCSKKETPTQVLFCELCEIFKNNLFASDCFTKCEILFLIVTGYSCKVVLKIFGKYRGTYLHRITSFFKLKVP